jgi:hypothetical protein
VQAMWMKDAEGLVANLLGPCQLKTNLGSNAVQITENTNYPYQNDFDFMVKAQKSFILKIRKPEWVEKITCNVAYETENGYLKIKLKAGETKIKLAFETSIQSHTFGEKENYFSYGPLIYAHPIAGKEATAKTFHLKGFADLKYRPLDTTTFQFITDHKANFKDNVIELLAQNNKTKAIEPIKLIPVGKTILRQVTF